MRTMDWIALILGVIWGIIILILWRRSKSKMWPRIFGIGGGIFSFVLMMTQSIQFWPRSEFLNYTISNFLWSLAIGIVCYFSGRKCVHAKVVRESEPEVG
jgi:hypothetical protein